MSELLLESVLAEAMRARDPVEAIARAADDPRLDEACRAALRSLDPDGVRMQALLVAKLRFERLLAGDDGVAEWFERRPEEMTRTFGDYHREVPMLEPFPWGEAAAFERWRASRESAG